MFQKVELCFFAFFKYVPSLRMRFGRAPVASGTPFACDVSPTHIKKMNSTKVKSK